MWIVTRDSDGAIIAGPAEEPPAAGKDETLRRVPMGTVWEPERMAFGDDARWIAKSDYVLLWPPATIPVVMQTTDVQMALAWAVFINWDGPVNLKDARVLSGIGRAEQLGILTAAQAQRIRDGLPPVGDN